MKPKLFKVAKKNNNEPIRLHRRRLKTQQTRTSHFAPKGMVEPNRTRHPQLIVDKCVCYGCFHVSGLCIILALYLQNEDSRAALFANPLNLLMFPATILAVAVILILSILYMRRLANRLASAQIQSAQGKVRLDEEGGEDGITYYAFVGKKKFAFSEDMRRVFREGEKYKVYYCKSGVYEMVLSHARVEG